MQESVISGQACSTSVQLCALHILRGVYNIMSCLVKFSNGTLFSLKRPCQFEFYLIIIHTACQILSVKNK